jgi:glutathione S-transferase
MTLPILYSLRCCPYAMRARLAILLADQKVLLRDIVIKNIPAEMLAASPKATVPLLILDDGLVIDESLQIMLWALTINDPNNLLCTKQENALATMLHIINRNDDEFVYSLEKYKLTARHHDISEICHRQQCELFIETLEHALSKHEYIMSNMPCLVDYAILPFIRQFARVDRKWYLQAPYPNLRRWLEKHFQNPLFSKTMKKYPQWVENRNDLIFPD